MTVAELLGSKPTDRLLLINCDDLGLCAESDEAILLALQDGVATSATMLTPSSRAAQTARQAQGLPIGVHLTLNSEWTTDRWEPLTSASSLRDVDGFLWQWPSDVITHARAEDVRAEWRAQVEQLADWGCEPTHLDSHMYIAQQRPDLFEIYLDLAAEYRLPVRLSGSVRDPDHPFRRLAGERGLVAPDHLVRLEAVGSRDVLMRALEELPSGLTEFHVHPAIDSPALRNLVSDWRGRVDDALLLRDVRFRNAIEIAGAEVVSYRALRDAARALTSAS